MSISRSIQKCYSCSSVIAVSVTTLYVVLRGVDSPPEHLDIFNGAPLRLPKPLSDQFHVRVCSCPLCIINRLCHFSYTYVYRPSVLSYQDFGTTAWAVARKLREGVL